MPEALAWTSSGVAEQLDALAPDLLVCVSARAWHPAFERRGRRTVIDYVDQLSRSYRQRAGLASPGRRFAYASLARAVARVECRPPAGATRVAAGWTDAAALGAEWLPITVDLPPVSSLEPEIDVLFFGTLAYPPNVAGTERLERLWPEILRRRPGTTALLAGSRPPPAVRDRAARNGWRMEADFSDVTSLCARARVAVAPLDHTAGIQIKVLDAAAAGLAQVVTPEALQGMAPGFPVRVAASDAAFVDSVTDLLDDGDARAIEGAAARAHVAERYTTEAWGPWTARLLDDRAGAESNPATTETS